MSKSGLFKYEEIAEIAASSAMQEKETETTCLLQHEFIPTCSSFFW